MTLILGPADANHFRVKVGRFGDRFYTDPLPADDLAPAAGEWVAPSFSTIKKASGNDWSFVAMKRIANADRAELERLPTLDPAQRYDTCKSINGHGLNVAAGRGAILHWWGEDMLHGRPLRPVGPLELVAHKIPAESLVHALRYLPALQQFFDTYQPELIATEYVALHRTLNGIGYGCTPDGLWKIEGDTWAYDFKSRSDDGGDHACYPEEGAQIGAGVRCEYIIVEGATSAERRRMPDVAGGMVVSIKPDGCRIFPTDIAKGFVHFEAMHAWWIARRTERDAIGKPWPVRKPVDAPACVDPAAEVPGVASAAVDRREQLRSRYALLSTHDKEWFLSLNIDADNLDAIEQALDDIDPFVPPPRPTTDEEIAALPVLDLDTFTPTLPQPTDEGEQVSDYYFQSLERDYAELDDEPKEWMAGVIDEARRAGVAFHANKSTGKRTERRYELYIGLMRLARSGNGNDQMVREIVATVLDTDVALQPALSCGYVLGSLDAGLAATFARICADLAVDPAAVELRNQPVA